MRRLECEAAKLNGEIISLSNSSDPYPSLEKEGGLTYECLRILAHSNCRIQIVTKSTLVTRDLDILRAAKAVVAVTITTDDDEVGKLIEPNAPKPSERLLAVEALLKADVVTTVRIDPLIPFVNTDCERLVAKLADLGVRQVTASTYKARSRDWRRMAAALPEVAEKLKPYYWSVGERVGSCVLLPRALRLKLLSDVRHEALQRGLEFAVCREGFAELNTAACDGSWLLPKVAR